MAFRSTDVPAPIQELVEPETRQRFWLYVPSTYTAEKSWPLVVVCHGTKPWDRPQRQIQDWVKLAEEKQFIVAVPDLRGTKGDFPPPAAEQINRQNVDEETILAVVRKVQGGYNVAVDKVFLAGWSAGSYAVLHTGLRNPDVFRAIAVIQGNFNSAYLSQTLDLMDAHQPIYVVYGTLDLLRQHSEDLITWLRDHDMYVVEDVLIGSHQAHPEEAYGFFRNVIERFPWAVIKTYQMNRDDPMTVLFRVRTSFDPARFQWDFGDGDASPVSAPFHTFKAPGTYEVSLTLGRPSGKSIRRKLQLRAPTFSPAVKPP